MHDDQATELRKMMQGGQSAGHQQTVSDAPPRVCRTIAICSGKGGVGKSNIALNLAIQLSVSGNRVALIDADMGLANLDVLVNADARGNLSHVVAGAKQLEDVVVELPSGVQFVAGASGLARLADLSEFERAHLVDQLSQLEADNEFMVVDCGAGINPDVLHFAGGADNVVVVTTPEPTAITDAYAMVKVLCQKKYAGHLSLLVNMASSRHEARDAHHRVADVARRFLGARVFNAGCVNEDDKVKEAVRRREPFVLAFPRCRASRCIAALANKLSPGGALVGRKEGFFRRVARLFA